MAQHHPQARHLPGRVELFEIPGPNYKAAPTLATPTWFSPGDANNGWFQMDGK